MQVSTILKNILNYWIVNALFCASISAYYADERYIYFTVNTYMHIHYYILL